MVRLRFLTTHIRANGLSMNESALLTTTYGKNKVAKSQANKKGMVKYLLKLILKR